MCRKASRRMAREAKAGDRQQGAGGRVGTFFSLEDLSPKVLLLKDLSLDLKRGVLVLKGLSLVLVFSDWPRRSAITENPEKAREPESARGANGNAIPGVLAGVSLYILIKLNTVPFRIIFTSSIRVGGKLLCQLSFGRKWLNCLGLGRFGGFWGLDRVLGGERCSRSGCASTPAVGRAARVFDPGC